MNQCAPVVYDFMSFLKTPLSDLTFELAHPN